MDKLKFIYDEFMEGSKLFGEMISSIPNFLMLSFVYLIGVGLTSILAKVFGKRFIDNTTIKDSYWENFITPPRQLNEHYKQF